MWLVGVVSRRWEWVESMGVVVRRYIDFLILIYLSLLLLYLFFFAAASLIFVHLKKNVFRSLYITVMTFIYTFSTYNIIIIFLIFNDK